MKKFNPVDEPIRFGLLFGIAGGITWLLSSTLILNQPFWSSLLGGTIWFATSMAISLYANKVKKKK